MPDRPLMPPQRRQFKIRDLLVLVAIACAVAGDFREEPVKPKPFNFDEMVTKLIHSEGPPPGYKWPGTPAMPPQSPRGTPP